MLFNDILNSFAGDFDISLNNSKVIIGSYDNIYPIYINLLSQIKTVPNMKVVSETSIMLQCRTNYQRLFVIFQPVSESQWRIKVVLKNLQTITSQSL